MTYTNRTALEAIINGANIATDNELRAKIETMLDAEVKKANRARSAEKRDSKEKVQNLAMAKACVAAMVANGNEPVGTEWLGHHCDGCFSSHQATGKMNIARANGWVERCEKKVAGKVCWVVTDAGIAMLNE